MIRACSIKKVLYYALIKTWQCSHKNQPSDNKAEEFRNKIFSLRDVAIHIDIQIVMKSASPNNKNIDY